MKQGLMNGVKDLKFRGRPSENPLDHLEAFDRLCNLYKSGNISPDTIRMMMFSYSLADDAADWEKEVSSELVSTWEDVKREFLKAFFPKEKTTRIRGEIMAFKQRRNETFAQAWDRMKRYLRSCPHHGFTRDSILGIFYKGCNASNRMHLDSASGGSFANRTVKEGEIIVADLAKGSSQPCDDEDYEHEESYEKVEDKVLKEMHRKLDLVLKGQSSRKEVSFVKEAGPNEGYYDPDDDYNEEMCYVENNQGFQNRNYSNQGYNNNGQQYRSNFNGQAGGQQPRFNSYQGNQRTFPTNNNNFNPNRQQPYNNSGGNFQRPPFPTNPSYDAGNQQNKNSSYQDRMEKLENLITRAMEDSNKVAIEYGRRIDSLGETINRRMDVWDEKLGAVSERVLALERNIADVAASMKPNGKGVLPGKSEPNPKEYCQYGGSREEDDDAVWKQEPSRNDFLTFNVNEIYDTHSLDDSDCSEEREPPITTPPPYYLPPPPFPDTTERAMKQAKAYADVSRTLLMMEGTEELEEMLTHDSYFSRCVHWIKEKKAWYENRSHPLPIRSSERPGTAADLEQIRYVMEKLGESEQLDEVERKNTEVLEHADCYNREEQGSFGISCQVNGVAFRSCTLDLGSRYSIMPRDIARAIGITNIERASMSLSLTDWTMRGTSGYAANIPVTIEGHTTTTDFLILNTKKSNPGRIVLGRLFLEKCNAKFDAKGGLVSFRFIEDCCTLARDVQENVRGRRINPSKIKFFQLLVMDTKERASCLGDSIELGRKHRILELVEEFEAYQFMEINQGGSLVDTMAEGSRTSQGRKNNRYRKNRKWNKKGKALMKEPAIGSVSSGTPKISKTPRKGVEIFEWRVKPKEATPQPSAEKAKPGHDISDSEKAPSAERETQGDQGVTELPREGEIEPGDKQVDTSGILPLPI